MAPAQAMSPEEMSAMQKKAGAPQGSPATDLVKKIGAMLGQLGQMIDSDPNVEPKEKEQMAQIMSLFVDLVENKLGSGSAQEDMAEGEMGSSETPKEVSSISGRSGVPVGPQSKN